MKRFAYLLLAALAVAGCASKDDGLDASQRQVGDKFSEIVQRSGGDWDKLTAEDRDFLVNKMANGNENAARMMFGARSGRAPVNSPAGEPTTK